MNTQEVLLNIADWFLDTDQVTPTIPGSIDLDIVVFFSVFLARKYQISKAEFRSLWSTFPDLNKFDTIYDKHESRAAQISTSPKFWEINTAAIIAFPTQNQWQQ
jgi:hypothetical protein